MAVVAAREVRRPARVLAAPAPDRPVHHHRHHAVVLGVEVVEVRQVEDERLPVHQEGVAAGAEGPCGAVVLQAPQNGVDTLETLGNGGLAAADAGTRAVDDARHVTAVGEAAAGEGEAGLVVEGDGVAAERREHVAGVGEGVGEASHVGRYTVDVGAQAESGEAVAGYRGVDGDAVLGDLGDLDVGGGKEQLGGVVGGVAGDVESMAEVATGGGAEGVWNGHVAALAGTAR